jgi:hypothetical protein
MPTVVVPVPRPSKTRGVPLRPARLRRVLSLALALPSVPHLQPLEFGLLRLNLLLPVLQDVGLQAGKSAEGESVQLHIMQYSSNVQVLSRPRCVRCTGRLQAAGWWPCPALPAPTAFHSPSPPCPHIVVRCVGQPGLEAVDLRSQAVVLRLELPELVQHLGVCAGDEGQHGTNCSAAVLGGWGRLLRRQGAVRWQGVQCSHPPHSHYRCRHHCSQSVAQRLRVLRQLLQLRVHLSTQAACAQRCLQWSKYRSATPTK